ncbi:MAG TPA: TonB-dependent receptor [Steroidobacteraceae bacterium]|nr:TonB-dependent receptor [Steroidobacteraceae bacterium]
MGDGYRRGGFLRPSHSRTGKGLSTGRFLGLVAGCTVAAAAARAQGLPAAAQGATDDGTQLQTIVVTATKRREDVQNVAGAVTAITGSSLSATHSTGFESFAAYVPGLSFQSAGPTSDLVAIRGITTGGAQLSGAIGMYVDEVPVGASSSFGLAFQTFNVSTFDLQRIEVLNGPQGTVYGSNALGGTIKYITIPPDPKHFAASGQLEGSSTDHGSGNDGARAMINIPLLGDRAALRIDGLQQFDSGYARDPFNDRDDQGKARTLAGRVSFLAQLTPDLDLRLGAFSQDISAMGYPVALHDPVTGQPTYGTYDQDYALAQPSVASLRLYSAVVNWHLQGATLTSVSGYQLNSGRYLNDDSDVYNPLLAAVFGTQPYGLFVHTVTTKITQELRLASTGDTALQWLVGAFYDHEDTRELVDLQDDATPSGLLAGFAPFYGVLPSIYSELAGFGDVTYHFNSAFDTTLGVRYSNNRQRYQQFAYGLFVVPTDPVLTTHEDARSTQHVVTYLINPRLHITDHWMVYAKAASGYRPGGPNFVLALGQAAPTFAADTLWNYELGTKSSLFGDRVKVDFDIYDIEWSKIQITVNNGGINQLENGGDARVRGAELSVEARVLPRLTLGGSAAYTDATLTTAAPSIGITYTGARLPISPRYNLSVLANYGFDLPGGRAGSLLLSDSYVGDHTAGYAGSLVTPLYRMPGYNTVNVDVDLNVLPHCELDFYAKNLFDTAGQVSAATLANEYDPSAPVPVTLSRPRTIGVELKTSVGE